jgi:DNA helicase-2/ATP-dependent DNA helicase PcrA
LLENPQDDTSFLRVVNFPTRGIGARSVEQLQDAALGSGLSLIQTANQATQMGQGSSSVRAFVQLIEGLRQDIATLSLQDTMALVLERSGLLAHYRKEKDGQDRVDNLQELLAAAQSFVHQEGFGKEAQAAQTALTEEGETLSPLAAFLTHAALESGDNQAAEGQDAVQLMTIHAAKGLEFNCVFMTGLEETLFPHENALSDIKGLEEERRLMYVALTRARQRLYLTHAQTRMLHGQTRYHLRSRFVDEIPPSTLKFLSGMSGMSGGGGSSRITGGQGWQSYRETGRSSSESQVFPQSPVHRPSPIEQASSSSEAIRVGMQVFHTKFGQGKVVSMEGQGPDARAQVAFIRHGVKWLALSIAKLTPV